MLSNMLSKRCWYQNDVAAENVPVTCGRSPPLAPASSWINHMLSYMFMGSGLVLVAFKTGNGSEMMAEHVTPTHMCAIDRRSTWSDAFFLLDLPQGQTVALASN
jgi:hypothetical protein